MRKFLFGADFGTSGVKGMLLDAETGEQFVGSSYLYPTFHRKPLWAEQDARDYWPAFCKAAKEVIALAGAQPEEIVVIALSSQGFATIPMGENGETLGDHMFWMDGRTEAQCKEIDEKYGDIVRKYNRNAITTLFPLPSVLWEKENDPDRYAKVKVYLSVAAYVKFKLTGKNTIDPTEGSNFHNFDIAKVEWADEVSNALGMDPSLFPPVYKCVEFIGEVLPEVAAESGFAAGTKVINGGFDTTSAAYGAGVAEPGQAFYSMGTGSNLAVVTDKPVYDPATLVQCHVVPGRWIMDSLMKNTGACLKWFNEEFCGEEKRLAEKRGISEYDIITLQAAQAQPGCGGVVYSPYMMGESSPLWDATVRASFVGITSRTKRQDMIRAVLEGIGFNLKQCLNVYLKNNIKVERIRVIGGPAKSSLWMQILADITNVEIQTTVVQDAAPLGDAMLCGVADGTYSSYEDAIEKNIKVQDVYKPNPENRQVYDDLFELFENVYAGLKDEYRRIAKY